MVLPDLQLAPAQEHRPQSGNLITMSMPFSDAKIQIITGLLSMVPCPI